MIIIIGAGISGISAAKKIKKDFLILEMEDYIGGLSTRYQSNGYWFDFGGHYFHFQKLPGIKKYLNGFCKLEEFQRKSKVFIRGRYIPFPIQFHLSYLPFELRKTIFSEMIEGQKSESGNLAEFLENNFGPHLYDLFFRPFLSKYYSFDLKKIVSNMGGGTIPVPDKQSIIESYYRKKTFQTGYNVKFYYPKNSMLSFFESYVTDVKKNIRLSEPVAEVDLDRKKITTKNSTYHYDYLISTMPLKSFLQIIKQNLKFPFYNELKNISTLVVNVVLKTKRKRFHWVYLPEEMFPFYRVGFYLEQKSPVVYLEKSIKGESFKDDDSWLSEIYFTLKKLQLIKDKDEIVYIDKKIIPISYVIFDKNWSGLVPMILKQLRSYGVFSIGRYGSWNYSSMSENIQSAQKIAQQVNLLP